MTKTTIHIMRDDTREMICVLKNGELFHEGTFGSFPGHENIGDALRILGYSVTEEGYEYE